jgi:hypothetical protein
MAESDVATGINAGLQPSRHGRGMPYMAESTVDLATALANRATGGALTAGDVVLSLDIPAKTMIMSAGVEVMTATDGATFTIDMGTSADADAFIDDMDVSSSVTAGTMSQVPTAGTPSIVCQAADTLDITLATLSGGAVTSGKIRAWAILVDLTVIIFVGIV